ncbi:MAG: copper amine oxidase N-terminal domain-containing protein [Dehalobacterium sp.]
MKIFNTQDGCIMKAGMLDGFGKLLAVFILACCMIIFVGPMPVAGGEEQAITELHVEDISYVEAGHADLTYLPLFYQREEDLPALKKIVEAVNTMSKHPIKYHEQDAWNAFFDTELVVKLKKDATVTIEFLSSEIVNLSLPGQEPFGVDPVIAAQYANLIGLFHLPESNISWPDKMVLGKAYPVQGETTEKNEMNIFVGPLRGDSGGNQYESVKGRWFPTKDALYIGSIPVRLGRYDGQIIVPPYGEDLNGKMVPIAPGKWSFYILFSGGEMMTSLVVAPSLAPLLTVNEQLVFTDSPPFLEQGCLLVPLRALMSALEEKVEWDGESNRVLINTEKDFLPERVSLNSIELWINGSKENPEIPPCLYQNRVFLPTRFIAELLGAQVHWEEGLKTVNIKMGEKKADFSPNDSLAWVHGRERLIPRDGQSFYALKGNHLGLMNETGSLLWEVLLPEYDLNCGVLAWGDRTLVLNNNGILSAINESGGLDWQIEGRKNVQHGQFSLTVAEKGLIYLSDDREVTAITAGGKKAWVYQVPDGIVAKPAAATDGGLYLSGKIGIYALTSQGTMRWLKKQDNIWQVLPQPDGTLIVYTGSGALILNAQGDELARFHLALMGTLEGTLVPGGPELWDLSQLKRDARGNTYAFSRADHNLSAYDQQGRLIWSYHYPEGSEPIVPLYAPSII